MPHPFEGIFVLFYYYFFKSVITFCSVLRGFVCTCKCRELTVLVMLATISNTSQWVTDALR